VPSYFPTKRQWFRAIGSSTIPARLMILRSIPRQRIARAGQELAGDEEEPLAIDYTSGTTGNPKGAVYSHRGAYLSAIAQVIEAGLSSSSVYLWTLPMFHCNGWCYMWAVTAVGGTHVCLRKLDPGLVWDHFDTEGVTHYNGAPTVHIFLVNHPRAHCLDRQVTTAVGGAPPSPTLLVA